MSTIKHAIIAAAGMGNRLGKGIPKSLVEINGRRILEYQLKLLNDIPNIRIIVGYMEDEVIEFAREIRDDIIFVRNPAFKDTLTLQSYYLGSKGIDEPCLFMDGDIIFDEESFREFIDYCKDGVDTIGLSTSISDDPVYVSIDKVREDYIEATNFQINPNTDYEWANIAALNPNNLEYLNTHVYQQLQKKLPMRAFEITRLEIDTPEDLKIAEEETRLKRYVEFD